MFDAITLFSSFATLASALVAGVFLTFSDFLMRSLGRMPDATGAIVMQAINRDVFRIVFMALFLLMAAVGLASFVLAWWVAPKGVVPWLVTGGACYVLGVFGVTAAGNVPLNNRLAELDTNTLHSQTYWRQTYLPRWTRLNSLRTAFATAAATAYLFAALAGV